MSLLLWFQNLVGPSASPKVLKAAISESLVISSTESNAPVTIAIESNQYAE